MTIPAIISVRDLNPPGAGFIEPLAMLHACHERVHRSLSLLREIGERVAAGRVDDAVHRAAADVLHYFDQAAPQHHEDEEQHFFPCVLAHTRDDTVRVAVMKLQEDHLAMEAQWARLRVPLAALANGHAVAYDVSQMAAAARFCALYDGHAQCEEERVFPLAAHLLDHVAMQAVGAEMARRRGARRT
jgi:hemerythrin-like domain-containing protein